MHIMDEYGGDQHLEGGTRGGTLHRSDWRLLTVVFGDMTTGHFLRKEVL